MFPTLYNYPGYSQYPGYMNKNDLPKFSESNKSNFISYMLLFFLVIFFIIIVVLLFINTTTKSKLINPSNCPALKSNYAIIPSANLSTLSVVNQCSGNPDGYQGSQPCTFSNINSVYDAQQLCNKYTNTICGGFAYNPTSKIVNFVNTSYDINTVNGNTNPADIYLKQNI
jgi:hypothetical protein